jgi:hypothetical protein
MPRRPAQNHSRWTAFKHATHQGSGKERDDDELLALFSDEQNDHTLFIGWYDYALATKTMPIEAQVHQAWYLALYQEKLDPKHSTETYEEQFPALRTKTRADQKRELNQTIQRVREDATIMADPRTDKRLVIPAALGARSAAQSPAGDRARSGCGVALGRLRRTPITEAVGIFFVRSESPVSSSV